MQEAARKLADNITEIKDEKGNVTSWRAPHEIWPFIEQLQHKGMALNTAAWLVRNWLSAGWVPPSVVASEQQKEIQEMREEMTSFKKTMADMQEWYGKLDDFLKERDKLKEKVSKEERSA